MKVICNYVFLFILFGKVMYDYVFLFILFGISNARFLFISEMSVREVEYGQIPNHLPTTPTQRCQRAYIQINDNFRGLIYGGGGLITGTFLVIFSYRVSCKTFIMRYTNK